MKEEKKKLLQSLKYPIVFVALLWLVKGFEYFTHIDLVFLGVKPRDVAGMVGIISSPLVHGSIEHLTSNSFPILILGTLILYFYPTSAKRVILGIYILTGIAVWLLARGPYRHIGASGLVYGLAFFLFFSGVFRNDVRSLAISFFIIFAYGGIVWGLFPGMLDISWESHLFGAIIGSLLAYRFRATDLPPKKKWFDNDEAEEISYRYIYVPKEERKEVDPSSASPPDQNP